MTSPSRHHSEWISLLEISGPFLSMPVLLDHFPHGLNELDAELVRQLSNAYDEWVEEHDDPAIHTTWVRYVLTQVLAYDKESTLLESQSIPAGLFLRNAQQGIILRPDYVLSDPETHKPRMLIQRYDPLQDLEKPPQNDRWQVSCISRMQELLYALEVPLGLITNGEQWLLVHALPGETMTTVSWYAEYWFSEPLTLRAFVTFLEARRFFGVTEEEALVGLIKASAENQHEVTDQLGAQVRSAVQILIQTLDKADQDRGRKLLKDIPEDRLYESAITVMMRLVIMLFAEEQKLFPVDDEIYDNYYAISTLYEQLSKEKDEEVLGRSYDAWCRLLAAARMVYGGVQHDRIHLPAYGGSLFNPDRFPFLEGRQAGTSWLTSVADPLPVDNRTILHLLEAIQFLRVSVPGAVERLRLSFRALDIEQIGHVYEGLLEYKAARASEVLLGLAGDKGHPMAVMALSELELFRSKGIDQLAEVIKDQTGRTASSIKNALKKNIDLDFSSRLGFACGNDESLIERIYPFTNLLREDDYENLVVIQPGSVYVTQGNTRRVTGTHYTPRSLTEPIVRNTLEPLVFTGPAEGLPEEKWHLKSPAVLLNLKICDMAMGSGSFLVQVIRYLSERLVESWEMLSPVVDPSVSEPRWMTPEGVFDETREGALPNNTNERLRLARRLVADRCIYGVDKNPLAVEMGKLSIWLVTMDKECPFTFLDHALKCGDSLVGIDEQEFLNWARTQNKQSTWSLFDDEIRKELELAKEKRRELEAFQVRGITDIDIKENLLQEAEKAVARIKLGCDLLIGARLQGLPKAEQEQEEGRLLLNWMAGKTEDSERCRRALCEAQKVHALHWFLEFPEVFRYGGFNAFVGNPPFMAGMRISTRLGSDYYNYLSSLKEDKPGTADLCAYFFNRAFSLLRMYGCIGLIVTNTISQGDTREYSLGDITKEGDIYNCNKTMKWPGDAAVDISTVNIYKGEWKGILQLNSEEVSFISSLFDTCQIIHQPEILFENDRRSYIGHYAYGKGFVITNEEREELIEKSPKNKKVIFPFLTGDDINSSPNVCASRYAINFGEMDKHQAKSYSECWDLVYERVRPERLKLKNIKLREKWWIYARSKQELMEAISSLDYVFVQPSPTKYLSFMRVKANQVFAHPVVVFPTDSFLFFSILISNLHETWVRKFSSTLSNTLRYTPTDSFQTFPFPSKYDIEELLNLGTALHKFRKQVMQNNQEGLTDTYNRFHDPDEMQSPIKHLRELHKQIDREVARVYGWDDIDLGHGFHETDQGLRFTISDAARREILIRLLKLNHERYEEEVAQGLHDNDNGKKKKTKATKSKLEEQKEKGQMVLGIAVE